MWGCREKGWRRCGCMPSRPPAQPCPTPAGIDAIGELLPPADCITTALAACCCCRFLLLLLLRLLQEAVLRETPCSVHTLDCTVREGRTLSPRHAFHKACVGSAADARARPSDMLTYDAVLSLMGAAGGGGGGSGGNSLPLVKVRVGGWAGGTAAGPRHRPTQTLLACSARGICQAAASSVRSHSSPLVTCATLRLLCRLCARPPAGPRHQRRPPPPRDRSLIIRWTLRATSFP